MTKMPFQQPRGGFEPLSYLKVSDFPSSISGSSHPESSLTPGWRMSSPGVRDVCANLNISQGTDGEPGVVAAAIGAKKNPVKVLTGLSYLTASGGGSEVAS